MSEMSDYLEQQIIDHLFRTATFAKPAAIFMALFTVDPTDSGGGTEVTGGAYAREEVVQLDANWNAPGTTGLTDNVNDIVFTTASGADWGTVTGMAIFDAVTGGNMLMWSALSANKVVNDGDTFKFSVGDLDVTFA